MVDEFADIAAIITSLDLVITVDTAIAHLAGALGKAVWVLLPFVADWRWFIARDDSPWYPTMRMFRQDAVGEWVPVIERVKAALFSPRCEYAASDCTDRADPCTGEDF